MKIIEQLNDWMLKNIHSLSFAGWSVLITVILSMIAYFAYRYA